MSKVSLKVIFNICLDSIKTDTLHEKKRVLLKLTCCFATSYSNLAFNIATQHLKRLFLLAKNDTSIDIRIIAAKALAKLTKLVGGYLEPAHLKDIIPALLELLYVDNRMGYYVSLTLNNIIVKLGDINTQRSNSKYTNNLYYYHNRQYFTIFQ